MPTSYLVQKPFCEYPVGNLNGDPEQSEADPNSLILVPNRIRSDGKDDCYGGQNKSDWTPINTDTVSPPVRKRSEWQFRSLHALSVTSTPTNEIPEECTIRNPK